MSSPQLVLLFKSHSVDFYTKEQLLSWQLPETLFKNEEVISTEYPKLLQEFVVANKIPKGKAIAVFSPELFFEHSITPAESKNTNAAKQTLLENLPFEASNAKVLQVNNGTNELLMAVDNRLVTAIQSAFQSSGISVSALFPSRFFNRVTFTEVMEQAKAFNKFSFL